MTNNDQDTPIAASTSGARQGVTGHNVRYVLLFGLLGVLIVFAILLVVFAS